MYHTTVSTVVSHGYVYTYLPIDAPTAAAAPPPGVACFAPSADTKLPIICLDVEDDIRLIRRIQRDIEERGRTITAIQKQYLSTVKPMHKKFVAPSKQFADIIIPHGAENPVAVELLVSKLNKI